MLREIQNIAANVRSDFSLFSSCVQLLLPSSVARSSHTIGAFAGRSFKRPSSTRQLDHLAVPSRARNSLRCDACLLLTDPLINPPTQKQSGRPHPPSNCYRLNLHAPCLSSSLNSDVVSLSLFIPPPLPPSVLPSLSLFPSGYDALPAYHPTAHSMSSLLLHRGTSHPEVK